MFTNSKGHLEPITSDHARHVLRGVAALFGEDRLGFTITDTGTHSIRSGAAIAMYLDNVHHRAMAKRCFPPLYPQTS